MRILTQFSPVFSLQSLYFTLFVGRKRHIIKSPSLNIERSDVTDNVDHSQGGNDQQLLAALEQHISNDESKTLWDI